MPAPPDLDLARIQDYCDAVVPPEMQGDVRCLMRRRGGTVTVIESRPVVPGEDGSWFEVPVARMKYDATERGWTLYWFDRNSKAHRYDFLEPHQPVAVVLDEVERDPTAIFWG